jgi:CDP-glucose 4,6-dehydratase
VLEPLTGYLQLAERLWKDGMTYAEGWNFGPGDDDAKPVSWVVDELARLWGDGARWETASDVHAPESNYLKLDSSKAKAKLDWKPKLSLPQALEWTVQWYKTYYRDQPLIREVTREQISYFQG